MRTFDENLNTYHALNAQNNSYVALMSKRLEGASTEEMKAMLKESNAHFAEQRKCYKELGEEMVEIMSKKWWQFWK